MDIDYLNKTKTEMIKQLNDARVTSIRLEGALSLIEQLIKEHEQPVSTTDIGKHNKEGK